MWGEEVLSLLQSLSGDHNFFLLLPIRFGDHNKTWITIREMWCESKEKHTQNFISKWTKVYSLKCHMKLENSKAECGDREGKSTIDGLNRRFSCLRSSRSAVFDMFPKVLVLDKLNENILLVSEKIHIFYPFAEKFCRHDCNFLRCSIQNFPMCSRQSRDFQDC